MNTAILIPFIVPTLVAIALITMLVRERDCFFNYKKGRNKYYPENNKKSKEEKRSSSNDKHPWDLWGTNFGI
jgi:hypothetical protein